MLFSNNSQHTHTREFLSYFPPLLLRSVLGSSFGGFISPSSHTQISSHTFFVASSFLLFFPSLMFHLIFKLKIRRYEYRTQLRVYSERRMEERKKSSLEYSNERRKSFEQFENSPEKERYSWLSKELSERICCMSVVIFILFYSSIL